MGNCVELPRPHAARPSGDLGGLATGLSPDPAVQMAELARQLPRRGFGGPEVGGYTHRSSRSRFAKARRRGEGELEKGATSPLSSRNGQDENADEGREDLVQSSNCPTQAKIGIEWATHPYSGFRGLLRSRGRRDYGGRHCEVLILVPGRPDGPPHL